MPVVSPPVTRVVTRIDPNGFSTGKQTFDGQEVPQRGAEIWWIVQCEGPLSCEPPVSRLRYPLLSFCTETERVLCSFLSTVSVSAVPNRLVTGGRQIPRCGRVDTRRAGYRDGTFERVPRAGGDGILLVLTFPLLLYLTP